MEEIEDQNEFLFQDIDIGFAASQQLNDDLLDMIQLEEKCR